MSDRDHFYGGISGAELPVHSFDLGEGLILSRTYAHLMAPFLMAFAPAEAGKPHPAPWRAARGGLGYDVVAQLHVPGDFNTSDWWDHLNTIWWIIALMRLRAAHSVTMPVVSDVAFDQAAHCEREPRLVPIEASRRRLQLSVEPSILLEEDLEWIRLHWRRGGALVRNSAEFSTLFQSFDQCLFVSDPSLALLMLWGAIEAVFSPARTELRFRVSANIAAYLEGRGEQRRELQRRLMKLYDARSAVAHGGSKPASSEALCSTYTIARHILIRVIESDHVPTRDDLDQLLFE